MVIAMAMAKITITLDSGQLQEIGAAGHAANVSAFVKHAVRVALHDATGWKEMPEDALRHTGGPLTAREGAWADAVLLGQRQRTGARKRRAV
jgi:hypothetical protein